MEIHKLPIEQIEPADWNANEMSQEKRSGLIKSIERFGLVVPLVVRLTGKDRYETLGGAQRLSVMQELGKRRVPAVVLEADNAEARIPAIV